MTDKDNCIAEPKPKETRVVTKVGIEGHVASFLMQNATRRNMNILGPKMLSKHVGYINAMLRNGDNAQYIYLANEGDGIENSGPTNPYNFPFSSPMWGRSGKLNMRRIDVWRTMIAAWQRKGLGTSIFWLLSDDSKNLLSKPVSIIKQYMTDIIPAFDDLASGFVLCLEADEVLKYEKIALLAEHYHTITNTPLGMHTRRDFENKPKTLKKYASLAKYWFHQYGWELSLSEIGRETEEVISLLPQGVKLVGCEYDKSSEKVMARKRGDRILASGAVGVGCGANLYRNRTK